MTTNYLFGADFDSSRGSRNGYYFQIGRVKSLVLGPYKEGTEQIDFDYNDPSDIGKIRYELLYSTLGTSESQQVSEPAYPIFNFIKQYPLINEIVLLIVGPSEKLNDRSDKNQAYYFPSYNLWNHVNHSAFPNMNEYYDYLTKVTNGTLFLGSTITENPTIKNLRPFEGDTIFQSRFGQSIRFGRTVPQMKDYNTWSNSGGHNSPITIITNSQGERITKSPFDPIVEDINKDGSSIYLTSTQEINLVDINNFPLKSFGVNINPIVQNVVKIQRPPTSDEIISAQFQDENTNK